MKNGKHKEWLAVVALSMLLVSCDKNNDVPDNELPGAPVAIRIRSLNVAEGGGEAIVRSTFRIENETVSMPLGDGLLLEMRMERDSSCLRAGQILPLDNGSRFRVIAVKHADDTYVSHGDFTVGPGEDTELESFHVLENVSYDFICFSYNKDSLPSATDYVKGALLPTPPINGSVDVMWCKIEDVLVNSAADAELSITLYQQLARVRVVVDCKYNGWTITGIANSMTLGPAVYRGTMDLTAGTISSTNGWQTVRWSGLSPADEQTSNQLLVMPKASGELRILIPVGAISRDGLPSLPSGSTSTNVSSIGIYTTALDAGASYKFYVRLRAPKWAASNIYWVKTGEYDDGSGNTGDVGYLTFDPTDDTHQGYQGIFFKWGSLVGISPALTGSNTPVIDFSEDTPVYIPVYNASEPLLSTWRSPAVSDYTATGWVEAHTTNIDAAATIPYLDGRNGNSTSDRDNTFVIDADRNDPMLMYANLRGDICQYLGATRSDLSGYRLPMSSEFGGSTDRIEWDSSNPGTTPVSGGWVRGTNTFSTVLAAATPDGQTDLIAAGLGYVENRTMDVVFPASGYRALDGGELMHVGHIANYWSGSAGYSSVGAPIGGARLSFGDLDISTYYSVNRSYGFPIRCVKN
jgi:hypothetical protein